MSSRALITGAAGFVGRHLARFLESQGLQVIGADLGHMARPGDWPGEWAALDVENEAMCRSLLKSWKPDHVFHLAALLREKQLTRLFAVQVLGTQHILEAVAEACPEAAVLIAGTAAEYGFCRPDEMPLTERSPLRPMSPYGLSKAAQGHLAFQYAALRGLRVVRTRIFNLTGPDEPATMVCGAFARQIVQPEMKGGSPRVSVGALTSSRDFVDVRDAVEACWLALRHGVSGEVYNVCSGEATLIRDVLAALLELRPEASSFRVEEDASRRTHWDIPIQKGSFELLNEIAGWKPRIRLRQSLSDLLASLGSGSGQERR